MTFPAMRPPLHRLWLVLLSVALVAAAPGCGKKDSRPNVVLVVIDTLRADHLPAYGYAKDTAPFISDLAKRGTVFDRAVATSSWTAPSTASIHTSLHPIQHGVLTGIFAVQDMQRTNSVLEMNRIPSDVETLAEVLGKEGYQTFGVSDNLNICKEEGFDQGFDELVTLNNLGADVVSRRVDKWRDRDKDRRPFFLYVHYMDPHEPYLERKPWYRSGKGELENTIAAYDSEVRFVDKHLSGMYESLDLGNNTLLIVTSDHGEEFGDHGGMDHGRTLFQEVVHVPLIVCSPEGEGASTGRVGEHVSLLDIVPTIRDILGVPASPADEGESLLPLLKGSGPTETHRRRLFADLRSPPWHGGQTVKSVWNGDWKYIVTLPDQEELYDLASDPGEHTNLVAEAQERTGNMRDMLHEMEAGATRYESESTPLQLELTDELKERLRSLGYLR